MTLVNFVGLFISVAWAMPLATTTPNPLPYLPPEMIAIAQCESGAQQFTQDGAVLHGVENPADIGLFQINRAYWEATAKQLGYDIYTERGNIEMALWLHRHYGDQPWTASEKCWEAKV